MSEAVKNIFSTISPTYDRLNHFLSFNFDKSWRKKTIAGIRKNTDEKFLALDVCAGTHDMGIACLHKFPQSTIHALDFSEGMLAAGSNKIVQANAIGQIIPIHGDALNMPFSDATFDVIFCAYGARNFDDVSKGITEMHRVLKPGGQLFILEFFKPTSLLNIFFNKTYGEYVLPRIGKWISGHQGAYTYLRDSIRGFLTTNEFNRLLETHGFNSIQNKNFFLSISTCVSAVKTS
jgi:demethylmenaquinone methyltransferase/2-methoxy-6-polyprenyl-1,4-benzoquinol methylase